MTQTSKWTLRHVEILSGSLRRTRYDVNIVSTETKPAHEISVQDENKLTQDCEELCLFLSDGLITSITCDQHMMIGPFMLAPSMQEDSDLEKDDKHASLQQLIPWWQQCSLFDPKKMNREQLFFSNLNEEQCTMQYLGLICGPRKKKSDRPSTKQS